MLVICSRASTFLRAAKSSVSGGLFTVAARIGDSWSGGREDNREEGRGVVISDDGVIEKFTKEEEMDVGLPPGVRSEEACEDWAEL